MKPRPPWLPLPAAALIACAGAGACATPAPLSGDLQAVENYERRRTVLQREVARRVAYFEPGARDWSLLVTEHRGAADVREVLEARDDYADRWRYLQVGPAEGFDIAGGRALIWNVALACEQGPPRRLVQAVLPLAERTVVLEYRGRAGGSPSFDELRAELARFRPLPSVARGPAAGLAAGAVAAGLALAVKFRRQRPLL